MFSKTWKTLCQEISFSSSTIFVITGFEKLLYWNT